MHVTITQAPLGDNTNRWLDLNTTNEQHHSLKCISSSQLKHIAGGKSMNSFYRKYILKEGQQEFIKEFMIGTVAHLAVLEPEKFENTVKVCTLDQRTVEYKNFKNSLAFQSKENPKLTLLNESLKSLEEELQIADTKEQTKVIKEKIKNIKKDISSIDDTKPSIIYTKNGGFLNDQGEEIFLVTEEEMKMFRAYQKQVEDHPRLSIMFHECVIEQTGVAQDPTTGLWLSLRGDARCPRGYFIDPKTIADELSEDSIAKYCANYHLAIQDAHYIETANLIEPNTYKKFFFVMMSKKAPYEIALIQLDAEARSWAKKRRKELLENISKCELSDNWPAIDKRFDGDVGLTITLPRWGYK
jgi:hypothetical protein